MGEGSPRIEASEGSLSSVDLPGNSTTTVDRGQDPVREGRPRIEAGQISRGPRTSARTPGTTTGPIWDWWWKWEWDSDRECLCQKWIDEFGFLQIQTSEEYWSSIAQRVDGGNVWAA